MNLFYHSLYCTPSHVQTFDFRQDPPQKISQIVLRLALPPPPPFHNDNDNNDNNDDNDDNDDNNDDEDDDATVIEVKEIFTVVK